ncbi:hypothetical protein A2U01_0064299, partial [Trifolium medium]|nr:hypothetical protein [Trifolium medium]
LTVKTTGQMQSFSTFLLVPPQNDVTDSDNHRNSSLAMVLGASRVFDEALGVENDGREETLGWE